MRRARMRKRMRSIYAPDDEVSTEELARQQGVRPVESVDEMARPDLFESDKDWEEFLADLYNSRHSGLA